jgi:hypothetical protein
VKTLLLLPLVLLTGCASFKYTSTVLELPKSTLVNNSGYTLKVYQNGDYVCDLTNGCVMVVKNSNSYFPSGPAYGYNQYGLYSMPHFSLEPCYDKTLVSVTGYDSNGSYVGASSWTYMWSSPENWTVTRLYKPQEPQ